MTAHTPISSGAYNLFNNTSWVLMMPITAFSDKIKSTDVLFNISSFTLPGMGVKTSSVGMGGVMVKMPVATPSNDEMTTTIQYKLSANLIQYKLLYNWRQRLASTQIGTEYPQAINVTYFDIPVFLLSSYKKPIAKVVLHNAFLESFDDLVLSYTDAESALEHSFTLSFSHHDIQDVTEDDVYKFENCVKDAQASLPPTITV